MQVRMTASAKDMPSADLREPIHCALVSKPNQAEKHKRELLRYVVLAIALVAVFLLIAIALYYTQGHSITIEHMSSLGRHIDLRV